MEHRRFLIAGLLFAFLLAGCTQPAVVGNETNATNATSSAACVGASSPNASVAGYVITSGVTYSDMCVNSSVVLKYYCSGNASASAYIACDENETCSAGACAKRHAQGTTSTGKNCIETDNLKDFYVAGSVAYGGAVYNDTCLGAYDLLEYYCENDTAAEETYHCPAGDKCENGACTQMGRTCQDSDTSNQSVAGVTTVYGGGMVISTNYDTCLDNMTVKEYGCASGSLNISYVACKEGELCYGGNCRPYCERFIGSAGTGADVMGQLYADYCTGNNTLQYYECSDGELQTVTQKCAFCYDAKCLSDSEISCQRAYNGVNLKSGQTIISWKTNECLDFTLAKTYICDGNEVATVYKSCTDNQVCQDGSCNQITGAGCYVLNGRDVHVKSGIAITTTQSILETKDNICFTPKILEQFYCDGADQKVDYVSCPGEEVCNNGVCQYPYTCSVTTTRDSSTAGTVSLYEGTKLIRTESDLCTGDPYIVRQVSCASDGSVAYTNVRCTYGTKCDIESGTCK